MEEAIRIPGYKKEEIMKQYNLNELDLGFQRAMQCPFDPKEKETIVETTF